VVREANKLSHDCPSKATIVRWAKIERWFELAAAHDKEVQRQIAMMNAPLQAAQTPDITEQTFNARQVLESGASKILKRIDAFLSDDDSSMIKNWADAKTAHDVAISAVRLAEVLRGGEVDRKVTDELKDEEDVDQAIEEEFNATREQAAAKVIEFVERKKLAYG
jgi:hypothetical protein